MVTMAAALAKKNDKRLSFPELEAAIIMREEFEKDFKGAGAIENRHSYT